jgi:hypothetical protein
VRATSTPSSPFAPTLSIADPIAGCHAASMATGRAVDQRAARCAPARSRCEELRGFPPQRLPFGRVVRQPGGPQARRSLPTPACVFATSDASPRFGRSCLSSSARLLLNTRSVTRSLEKTYALSSGWRSEAKVMPRLETTTFHTCDGDDHDSRRRHSVRNVVQRLGFAFAPRRGCSRDPRREGPRLEVTREKDCRA